MFESILSGFSVFGFSGSRSVFGSPAMRESVLLLRNLSSFSSFGFLVGDASGCDEFFRSAFPSCRVFSVQFPGRGGFAARSASFVSSLSASGGLLLSFPAVPCPVGLVPSPRSSSCFCGAGSGSWASLAFAVGSGVPSLVFLPPGVSLPCWPGFSQVDSLGCGSSVWFFPGVAQLSLF